MLVNEGAMSDRPQLHISGLDKLWACGEQFRLVYIERERLPRSTYMLVGSGVDTAVNRNLEHKMETGSLLDVEEVKQIARDAVDAELVENEVALDPDELEIGKDKALGQAIDKAVRLAALHARETAAKINPIAVQRKWALEIPGFPFDLVGTIDVQEQTAIRDTKTAGKTPSADIAHNSDQLTMYALAVRTIDGVAPELVALDYLIDNKTPVAKTFTSTRDVDDFQVLLNRLENAAEIIEKGAFTPAKPTDWVCSATYCGFHRTCRYAKQPKSVFVTEAR